MSWVDGGPLTASVAERMARGREVRDRVPIESHAELVVDGRPDPIALLTTQDAARLPELVPIRHGRMRVNPFTFYRGGAAIMASDLSRTPSTQLSVQLCGDAHLSNFGVFRGPDRRMVFDLNDFDETSPGPFEWDLKRLVASVAIAARNNGLDDAQARSCTRHAVRGYREVLDTTTSRSPLDVHYYRIEVDALLAEDEELRKRSRKALAKATRKDSVRALSKLTEVVDGRRRIIADPPLVVPLDDITTEDLSASIDTFYGAYRASLPPHRSAVLDRYRVVDVARKVVGVGSVGTRCLIVLLQSGEGAPLFLQFKEAVASVLEPYAGPSGFEQAGERVVRGQRLMQAAGDVFLGWARFEHPGRPAVDFYFRQLWDGKGSVEVEQMGPKRLKKYAWHCGGALALAHARTGDGVAISGYLGDDPSVDDVFAEFADRYAELNDADHAAHESAIESGRVVAAGEP